MPADITVPDFKSSDVFVDLNTTFTNLTESERQEQIKKVKGVFEFRVDNDAEKTAIWTIDLKNAGTVYKGKAEPKADVTLILKDDTLVAIASGKLNGQKAFMSGKLKTKGNMMLATKLDAVFNSTKAKL